MYLNQFGGGQDIVSTMLWFVMMFVFFFFYPRMMLSQIMYKLESTAKELEAMSDEAEKFVLKELSSSPSPKVKESVKRFFEFFVIAPADLDPAGLVRKFDHVIRNERDRFRYFVKQVDPRMDEEKQACMQMGLAAGMTVHQIAKVVRHFVETIKKEKSYQMAMIIQMQLPMVERIAKAMLVGTKAMSKGKPIGDALGPYVAAKLIGSRKVREIADEVVMAEVPMKGRKLFVMKASGPGGRLGDPGKAVEAVAKKHKIARIISIDAAAKMEGEKTGSVAEGVGVAMGGPGVERSYIEAVAVNGGIPMDSIIVKMGHDEAIKPMRKAVKDALPQVMESIERSIDMTKKGDKLVVVGVGNTSGVGNSGKTEEMEKWVDKYEKKLLEMEKNKKNKGLPDF